MVESRKMVELYQAPDVNWKSHYNRYNNSNAYFVFLAGSIEMSTAEGWQNIIINQINEIKLNEFSKLPTHIQVLIAKQADLISAASLTELRERIDFSFSSIQTKSADENKKGSKD